MQIEVAIFLAGGMSSGKTSVAQALGQRILAPTVSFGETIRALHPEAIRREQLQTAGAETLELLGPNGMVKKALEINAVDARQLPVVWEGVRHDAVLDALQDLYSGVDTFLFFLKPDDRMRRERVSEEAGDSVRFNCWESHKTEELGHLKQRASLVITAASVDEAAEQILAHVGRGR